MIRARVLNAAAAAGPGPRARRALELLGRLRSAHRHHHRRPSSAARRLRHGHHPADARNARLRLRAGRHRRGDPAWHRARRHHPRHARCQSRHRRRCGGQRSMASPARCSPSPTPSLRNSQRRQDCASPPMVKSPGNRVTGGPNYEGFIMRFAKITERLSGLGSEKWAVHIEASAAPRAGEADDLPVDRRTRCAAARRHHGCRRQADARRPHPLCRRPRRARCAARAVPPVHAPDRPRHRREPVHLSCPAPRRRFMPR